MPMTHNIKTYFFQIGAKTLVNFRYGEMAPIRSAYNITIIGTNIQLKLQCYYLLVVKI